MFTKFQQLLLYIMHEDNTHARFQKELNPYILFSNFNIIIDLSQIK